MHSSNSSSSSMLNEWEPKIDFSKGIESPIEILNDDAFFAILSFLDFSNRIMIERVSHKWRQFSQESWRQVNKFDFSYETWGILPKHDDYDEDCDLHSTPDASSNSDCSENSDFCPKALEKVLTLSADTLTHCDFSMNAEIRNDYQTLIKLSERALSEFFKSCRNLKWLKIVQDDWVQFPVMSLINLRTEKLEELHLNIYCEDEVEIACFREIFKNSPCLHTIEMENIQIEPEQLEMIVNKDALKSLTLYTHYPNNAEEVVRCLTKFKNLENYGVENLEDITDELLKKLIDNCKKLKSILLKRTEVTDRGILQLKSLPDLRILKLLHPRQISGDILHHFPNLECLECYFAPSIKDEGIIKLLNSSQTLKKLKLINTGITIDCLKAANEAVKNRTNGLPLEIIVFSVNQRFHLHGIKNISPLLKIVKHEWR